MVREELICLLVGTALIVEGSALMMGERHGATGLPWMCQLLQHLVQHPGDPWRAESKGPASCDHAHLMRGTTSAGNDASKQPELCQISPNGLEGICMDRSQRSAGKSQ